MKLSALAIALVCLVVLVTAQQSIEPNRTQSFAAKDLDSLEKTLMTQSRAAQGHYAGKDLLNVPTHLIGLRNRSGPAPAEQHPNLTDVLIVKSGAGAIQIGGEIVDPRGSGGELRGTSIRGGQTFPASAGDVFNIPPHVAHQWILKTGDSLSFFTVKVREKPAS